MRMTNWRNRLTYGLWAPIYDTFFTPLYGAERRRSLQIVAVQPGERVLLPGVGTGVDLPSLPAGAWVVGLDLSPEMLDHARARLTTCQATVFLVQGDAQQLPLAAATFDAAILNLVVSVVPDGAACWRETVRVVRAGGRAVIFDKFLPDHAAAPSLLRRLLNLGATLVGTDINRRLGDILAGTEYAKVHEESSAARGAYRIVLLRMVNYGCSAWSADVSSAAG